MKPPAKTQWGTPIHPDSKPMIYLSDGMYTDYNSKYHDFEQICWRTKEQLDEEALR